MEHAVVQCLEGGFEGRKSSGRRAQAGSAQANDKFRILAWRRFQARSVLPAARNAILLVSASARRANLPAAILCPQPILEL